MRPRPGYSLVELLTALLLGGILAAVLGGALVAQLRLARTVSERVASTDALRTARAVLQAEIGRASAADVRALARDSIALRAFRGGGDICAAGLDRVTLRYRGDRLPDPRKDSLLVLTGSGAERILPIADVRHVAPPCALSSGEAGLEVRTGGALPPASGVGLVFESGMYYVSTRALRYRTGAEGRQPLTPELFVQAESGFSGSTAGIHLRLQTARGDSARVRAAFLHGRRAAP